MKSFIHIQDLTASCEGRWLSTPVTEFQSVGTDTRKSLSGQLFVALKGDSHDAHDYLDQAVAAGATGLVLHRWDERFEPFKKHASIFLVNDTLSALQKLGRYRRQQWNKPIIAITGSNGKTTTKEFTAQILSAYKKVHYNQGSFNNHWGLPLTLLGLQPDHEVAICEMGMNHLKEIETLVTLAEPNIVGVTMVGRAHLEGLGSIEAVARAKEEIYATPNEKLHAGVFNLDNPWTQDMMGRFQNPSRKVFTFSSYKDDADVVFRIQEMTLEGMLISARIMNHQQNLSLPIFGSQNIYNLMFAACAALAAGLTAEQILTALPRCKTIWGRNQRLTHSSGTEILFDGYNANPDSQKALIDNLRLIPSSRPLIGVFGEMRELGAQSPQLHKELGELVSSIPFEHVFFVGNYGEEFREGFEKNMGPSKKLSLFKGVQPALTESLSRFFDRKPLVTIKGSRGVKLEQILKDLELLN